MKFLTQKEMTPAELALYNYIQDIIWDKFLGFFSDKEFPEELLAMREIKSAVNRYNGVSFASLCHLFYLKPVIVNAAGGIICSADETISNPKVIK